MRERVIRSFIDKETKKPYNDGSFYESDDEERLEFLKDKGYLYKEPEKEKNSESGGKDLNKNDGDSKDKEFPYHKGGGNYELSNGETVKGKEDAIAAQEALDKEGE
ncbi:MAG: hypothetical protein ACOCRO_02700 [Halanaerobiales bacterium]